MKSVQMEDILSLENGYLLSSCYSQGDPVIPEQTSK